MLKKSTTKLMMLTLMCAAIMTSCKKEEVLAPDENTGDSKTVIYIRAVDKDSSVVESEQLLLR